MKNVKKVNCKDCTQSDCAYFGMNNKTSCKDFTAKEESRLTDAEILEIGLELFGDENDGPTLQQSMKFARAIEAKLKEKNEH